MKGYNITFTQQNSSGTSEEITQLDGEITLTFQLTPQELEGIDPSTLVVYKRAADGSISQFSAEFDWATNSLSITTSHLCEFFIMGKQGIPLSAWLAAVVTLRQRLLAVKGFRLRITSSWQAGKTTRMPWPERFWPQ
jgi:hypothetical protein